MREQTVAVQSGDGRNLLVTDFCLPLARRTLVSSSILCVDAGHLCDWCLRTRFWKEFIAPNFAARAPTTPTPAVLLTGPGQAFRSLLGR